MRQACAEATALPPGGPNATLALCMARSEKNWTFLEQGSELLIIYSMLPCTVVFAFQPASSKGVEFRKGLCYKQRDEVPPPCCACFPVAQAGTSSSRNL